MQEMWYRIYSDSGGGENPLNVLNAKATRLKNSSARHSATSVTNQNADLIDEKRVSFCRHLFPGVLPKGDSKLLQMRCPVSRARPEK